MNPRRIEFLKDKALVLAIGEIQNRKSDHKPVGDMLGMIDVLKSEVRAEYLALLVFEIEQSTGVTVDMFPDWEDRDDHTDAEIDYGARHDTALQEFRASYIRCKELSENGALNGSNIIDFASHKRRRELAA
ncbi:hypothetical protein ACI0FM_03090 [Paenochrobactrum sp. BZR 588]|uniref:hypothetical protein n=1 Tax=unclassified Paenochrobactrum TaxID=2639760 RepID=UPI0038552106